MSSMEIGTFEYLYNAYRKCIKGVSSKKEVLHFSKLLFTNLLDLSDEIQNNTYIKGEPHLFKLLYPKPREIMSIPFRDRIYQRNFNDLILYDTMVEDFIPNNFACQKGKGVDSMLKWLKETLHRYSYENPDAYALQFDIKGYYPSLRHDYVNSLFKEKLSSKDYEVVLDCLSVYSGDVGYNPGSQLIQIAGISALNFLDHYIIEDLGLKDYARFMDDAVIIFPDKDRLKKVYSILSEKLAKISLSFNPKKTQIYTIKNGINMLGFCTRVDPKTHKIIVKLNHENLKHRRKQIRKQIEKLKQGLITVEEIMQSYTSWRAHALRGTSHNLIFCNMDKFLVSELRLALADKNVSYFYKKSKKKGNDSVLVVTVNNSVVTNIL